MSLKESPVYPKLSASHDQVACQVLRNHQMIGVIRLPSSPTTDEELRRLVGEYLSRECGEHPLTDSTVIKRMGMILVVNDPDLGYSVVGDGGGGGGGGGGEEEDTVVLPSPCADEVREWEPDKIWSFIQSGEFGPTENIVLDITDGYVYMTLPRGVLMYESVADKELGTPDENAFTGEVLIGEVDAWCRYLFTQLGCPAIGGA